MPRKPPTYFTVRPRYVTLNGKRIDIQKLINDLYAWRIKQTLIYGDTMLEVQWLTRPRKYCRKM